MARLRGRGAATRTARVEAVRLARDIRAPLRHGHPWVWRDALEGPVPAAGTIVDVLDAQGRFVARGFCDAGAIGVRILSRAPVSIDAAFFARRLARAAALRDRMLPPETNAYRLVHGEGDGLPGVVVDVYGEVAVLRWDGAGAERLWDALQSELVALLARRGVRSLLERRGERGRPDVRILMGERPEGELLVREHGMGLLVDVARGHKTGAFLDQRVSRARVRSIAAGLRVLDLYGYTGGFAIAAGLGGAERVTLVDRSGPALETARRAWRANGLPEGALETVESDVETFLRENEGRRWDLVIADPPSFAPNEASVPRALAAYRRLHAACVARLVRGGLHLACSCSSHVRREAFRRTLTEAAAQAGRSMLVVDEWGAPPDHPVPLAFPEGDYLKAILCVDGATE